MEPANRVSSRRAVLLAVFCLGAAAPNASVHAESSTDVQVLIDRGDLAGAERLLRTQIVDPDAPVVDGPAQQLEVLRRTRHDFSVDRETVLAQVRERLPDASEADLDRWTESGGLQHRVIDGRVGYFRRAASNLFLISDDARQRRKRYRTNNAVGFKTIDLVRELVEQSATTEAPQIYPVHHRVEYQLAVKEGHPRLRPGAVVRAWLPFPQAYRQQGEVRLLDSEPNDALIAPNGSPHRSLYYERVLDEAGEAPRFKATFEFVTHAYCPDLRTEAVEQYDTTSDLYRRYTAERLPHIAFTPEATELAKEIVGGSTNPLEKARRVFGWVSQNIPWVGEMEYGIIPSLSAKGLEARRGDCGVQGMVFITLCRIAGVPARWQSGWGTRPGRESMHDWAEVYIEPWGWLPVDASYGQFDDPDPRVRDFFCGHMDPYRLIVNLDYARPLFPEKTSFRSEPNDFQRGEVEIDGHNLYFDEWRYRFRVETRPLSNR